MFKNDPLWPFGQKPLRRRPAALATVGPVRADTRDYLLNVTGCVSHQVGHFRREVTLKRIHAAIGSGCPTSEDAEMPSLSRRRITAIVN